MRICFINPTVLMRRPIADLALLLSNQGHEITVVTAGRPTNTMHRESDQKLIQAPQVKIVRVSSYEIQGLLWSFPINLSFYRQLKNVLKEQDIIHVWAPYYILSALPLWWSYRRRIAVPIVLTFDTFPGYSFDMHRGALNRVLQLYARWMVPVFRSAHIITLYSNQLKTYAQKIGLPMEKTMVLPTGIHFLQGNEKNLDRVRNAYGFAPHVPIILFAGLLNKRKGVDTLLQVARVLKGKQIRAVFAVAGNGPDRQKMEALIKKYSLENYVKLLGSQRDMKDLYSVADMFFLPSRGEGLPGVVMEAMGWKLPIVASDIPCLPDLVEHEKNGFLCPSEDVGAFAESLEKLLVDAQLRYKFGHTSWQKIQPYNWHILLGQYLQLYEHIYKA